MSKRLKNTSPQPVPLEDGRMVGPGEWAEVDKVSGITKDAVEAGQLTHEQEPTKGAANQRARAEKQED